MSGTELIHVASGKRFLLAAAKKHRPFHKYTRVSKDVLLGANETLRRYYLGRVAGLPSKGKTI